jgi:CubicO group peptidase (beta-lactamase class C family)
MIFKRVMSYAVAVSLVSSLSCELHLPGEQIAKPAPAAEKERIARFGQQLEELRAKLKIPGLSAAIVKEQNVVWAKGFGLADVEKQIPATPQTNYRIASLTKTFASTLLMQLVEAGKLDLDEPMSKFSPAFQREFDNAAITVRHVFTHTSHGNPGASYRYDGNRFSYLSDVIEKVSGKPFRELLAKNILDKIELTDSVPGQNVLEEREKWATALGAENLKRYERALQKLAKPYLLYGAEVIEGIYPQRNISASAGLISNVLDLAKYDAAIDRHTWLKPETQAKAWTAAVSPQGRALPYGLGWFVQQHRGLRLIWHYGHWPQSFSSLYLKVPEKKLTFILLANSDALSAPFRGLGGGNVLASAFASTFIRIFSFEDLLGRSLPDSHWAQAPAQFNDEVARLRKQTGDYNYEAELFAHDSLSDWLETQRNSARTEIKLDPKLYESYVGQYELRPDWALTISREGNKLFAQMTNDPKVEIFPEAENQFFFKVRDVRLTFARDSNGQVTGLEMVYWGRRFNGRKIK